MKKKNLFIYLAALVIILAANIRAMAAGPSLSLDRKSTTLETGNSIKLEVKGAKGKVEWSTSDKSIASVRRTGKVTARRAGTAKITAVMRGCPGKRAVCRITVTNAWAASGHARIVLTETEELYEEQYLLKQKKYMTVYGTRKNLLKHTVCFSAAAGCRPAFRVDADVVVYQPADRDYWEYTVFLDNGEHVKPFIAYISSKTGVIGAATDWQLTI